MTRNSRLAIVTALTFLRIPLVLVFFACALVHASRPGAPSWLPWAAFGFLAASALTDMADGFLARRLGVVSNFGSHLDPLTDKVFSLATLPLLVYVAARNGHDAHAIVLLCMTVLFLLRDQWVSFLRSVGAGFKVPGHANWSGKLRTLISFPLICLVYLAEGAGVAIQPSFLYLLESAAIIITLVSLWVYTRRYWDCLRASLLDG